MQKVCSECKYANLPDCIICHKCGADISEVDPTVPAASSTEPLLPNTDNREICILERICFACNHPNAADRFICNKCGADISAVEPGHPEIISNDPSSADLDIPRNGETVVICSNCDTPNPPGSVTCARCGARILACEPINNQNPEGISVIPKVQTQPDVVESPQDQRKTSISNSESLIFLNNSGETLRFHSNDILGRCSVSIRDPNRHVSDFHAAVVFRNNSWFIRDTRSMNGTFINGMRIEPEKDYPIQTGDVIALSRHVTLCVQ